MKAFVLALTAACTLGTAPAQGACSDKAAKQVRVLPPVSLWPEGAPDLTGWPGLSPVPVQESTIEDGQYLFNVTNPNVQAFLPTASCATGAGVVIAPGGGFRLLSIRSEGTEVARWLAAHWVAAFVLKYRLVQNATISRKRPASLTTPDEILGQPGVADGIRSLQVIRADAARYGIDPGRLGAIGFSAGAHVTAMMGIADKLEDRPAFTGVIYSGLFLQKPPQLPAGMPPYFIAGAQDDQAAGVAIRGIDNLLTAAGLRPEVHYYAKGGHGFGMKPTGLTSERFIDEFYWWMQLIGMLDGAQGGKKP